MLKNQSFADSKIKDIVQEESTIVDETSFPLRLKPKS